ncbi:DUF2141 domain-containing protein [Umezakia ovalisporum]|jgi:uncharacterized protein (DUF2141 family)|uniref:DUF2141 domain-containing protein n=2 Tax=Umezakia ovalisporum TaxID=75695 RepID=A0AA43KDP2_9CYAN|nr:DUF2141 domain-containing protein [Umezakia ovalisporum]MBI1243160.1 DUF2141 domain-containing protein [Nostoc sp. RI_552]MDH6055377.1 DUF2141 domain-containing protein [Umezakia ovalisporum FSS-43]MDH6062550.1 DUF2141 domain-containing protein [Umezakia ovalisporum FSS-62]MDH6068024.1 DUF2141 domain-containing protein [Umezakia ovalisporum APH033B]MDH6069947.1 DUF2141 domain-containing protein [Umezakia ovalisporum CobakiLakeA]
MKFWQKGLLWLVLANMGTCAQVSVAAASFRGRLTVEVDGLRNTQGQVCVSVFSSSQGFPNNRNRVFKRQCKVAEKSLRVIFDNLEAGSYAVAVMHDQNNDESLNRNQFGMPIEGFGFSGNPEVRTSAPKFKDAAFLLAGVNTVIQVRLKHL